MKTEKNIFFAFILNLFFSLFEFVGGIFVGSVAIISDAVHDLGDAASIGVSFLLERKSKRPPDAQYTYGYARYSVVGSLITTCILIFGSVAVVYYAIRRICNPTLINYNGMIVFAIVGVIINFGAALLTKGEGSLNQKAVNLHMLEDVLGWLVVLIGAVVMRFTGWTIIDPLLSVFVSVFIFATAVKNLKECLEVLLEKTPDGMDINKIKTHICALSNVLDVHHLHVWTLDGQNCYATMHVVTKGDFLEAKETIRNALKEHGILHVTLELEKEGECCQEQTCHVEFAPTHGHHHHH